MELHKTFSKTDAKLSDGVDRETKLKAWRFTLVLETECESESEAVERIQQELYDASLQHPARVGDWERIDK